MKAIIVCGLAVIALAALVHGVDEHSFEPIRGLNSPRLVDLLSRTRRDDRVCEPGSTKAMDCNHCFCTEDGSGWGCTQKGCATQQLTVSDLSELLPGA